MLTELIHRLDKQNPNEPLEKGFVRVWQNGKWIKEPKIFESQQSFEIQWEKESRIIN